MLDATLTFDVCRSTRNAQLLVPLAKAGNSKKYDINRSHRPENNTSHRTSANRRVTVRCGRPADPFHECAASTARLIRVSASRARALDPQTRLRKP